MEKQCETCKEVKPLTAFYFRKESNKYRNNCKKCKPLISKKDISDKANAETKVCKHCGIEKKSSEYQKSGKWLQPYCKPCDAERKKKHYKENEDEIKQKGANKYLLNRKLVNEEQKKISRIKSNICLIEAGRKYNNDRKLDLTIEERKAKKRFRNAKADI